MALSTACPVVGSNLWTGRPASLQVASRRSRTEVLQPIMHVGVLGGGLQGCCAALALAARGVRVTIFDRNEALLTRTAVANEGKIHLGYMYAGDPSLSTARTMVKGAL